MAYLSREAAHEIPAAGSTTSAPRRSTMRWSVFGPAAGAAQEVDRRRPQSCADDVKLRLTEPPHLIDIARIPELSGIRQDDGAIGDRRSHRAPRRCRRACSFATTVPCWRRRLRRLAISRSGIGARSAAQPGARRSGGGLSSRCSRSRRDEYGLSRPEGRSHRCGPRFLQGPADGRLWRRTS